MKDGVSYPAYCLDKYKKGVDTGFSYTVSVNEAISDVKLWRVVINAYPYKTLEELGCKTREEAFTATKQAIYCYIHGNNPNDYSPIGEAGKRTLNALKKIVSDAEKCTETQISNTVKIIKEKDNFNLDSKEKEYASKTYSIKAATTISNYTVKLSKVDKDLPEGIKVTDINNNPKTEFSQNEKFKILIPIKYLDKENDFNIEVKTKINSKPVLYGRAPHNENQDYALATATYEDAYGKLQDKYYKNETKVNIIKQDAETKERLENVEFNILDSNKKTIYANLKTNSNGEIKITNLIPGKYYIQETSTREGYLLNDKLLEFNVDFNEEFTITINNLFEKVPEQKTKKDETSKVIQNKKEEPSKDVEVTQKEESKTVIKKLPVTGM